ncbi:hypothetical protein ABCS02_08875 [Microbacterium sp. X-17]|uniref:hypothetical protein n=1 Tax=Microbacterium sp. X-17 TaxID=3144404 RepID=UPI0031F579FE
MALPKDINELKLRLQLVNEQIAQHPLNSDLMKASNDVVESRGAKNVSAVEDELAVNELLPLEEIGRTTVTGLRSFARLHRLRRKLERRIARRQAR